MLNKKILILLSLIALLKLSCASNTGREIADELLSVKKPTFATELASISNPQANPFNGNNEGGVSSHNKQRESRAHPHWYGRGGLDDSDPAQVECMKQLISKRHKCDDDFARHNSSWGQYFSMLFKQTYSYLFSDRKLFGYGKSPFEHTEVVKVVNDELGVTTSGGGTIASTITTSVSLTVTDILKGMNFSSDMVYDQGSINACTAHVMGFIIRYWSVRNSNDPTNFTATNTSLLNPSRIYHYINATKLVAGKTGQDPNETVKAEEAIFAIDKYGSIPENKTTLKPSVFLIANKEVQIGKEVQVGLPYPVPALSTSTVTLTQPTIEDCRYALDSSNTGLSDGGANPYALISKNIRYSYIGNSVDGMKSALSQGFPIFVGFRIYSPFVSNANYYDPAKGEKSKPFFVPMPNTLVSGASQQYQGGHAMAIVGYGNYNAAIPSKKYFRVINSWGPNWADIGFCYFSEEYIAGSTIVNNSNLTVVNSETTGTTLLPNVVSAYSVYFVK